MQPSPHKTPTPHETPMHGEHASSGRETELKLPGRLLIAEDARCVQQNLLAILRKIHVKAEMVENGQMACDMVEKSKAEGRPYDLILMDMQMPQMNGYKAVEWLRQQGWRGPIVAISALASEKDQEKIIKAGCDGCAAKPINEAKLRDIFAQYLGGEHKPKEQEMLETKPKASVGTEPRAPGLSIPTPGPLSGTLSGTV